MLFRESNLISSFQVPVIKITARVGHYLKLIIIVRGSKKLELIFASEEIDINVFIDVSFQNAPKAKTSFKPINIKRLETF